MHQIASHRGRFGAPAPAALLLLALCLLAGSVQALDDPQDMAALVADVSLPAGGVGAPPAPEGYETPIVVNDADQVAPALYGTRIVWQDWRNGDNAEGDIYSFDLATRLELPEGAASSDYGKAVPNDYDPAVSSAGIFWVHAGRSDADINNEVRGRTLAGEPINLTYPSGGGYTDFSELAADADWVAFVFHDGSGYHLVRLSTTYGQYYYDRETVNEIRSPDVSGDTVTWQEYDGNDWNVWAVVPGHGSPIALANDPYDQVSPTVDGTRVVWADNRSGDWDLWTADLSQPNPVEAPWLVAPGDQANPHLDGDRLVWEDDRDGDWDIWLGSLSSGDTAPLCDAEGNQRAPSVDGDRIVWQDRRNGNWDIYLFTASSTGPVPVPTPGPLVIESPGTYTIAADGFDGTATPIEIRASNVVLDGGDHTIDGTGGDGSCGILVGADGPLSDVVVRNLRLTNWETGIRAENVTGSVIEDCEVAHNHDGIALVDARDVEVRDNLVVANEETGIRVSGSEETTVRDNDVVRTGDGFDRFVSWTMDESTFAIALGRSAGTVVSGNDLGGEYSSLVFADSPGTLVTGNQLTGRRIGIYGSFIGENEGCAVFNNVFRNIDNVYGSLANASWNTTPSPGPNIVGGPQLGGNFWATPDGTGFSETTPDADGDGFSDEPFETDFGRDSLPLAPWTGPVVVALPGGAGLPTDPNGDGTYDDVNGNGRADFADVVLYFNQMAWIADHEPPGLFDYNANGRIDFADVVWLFNAL